MQGCGGPVSWDVPGSAGSACPGPQPTHLVIIRAVRARAVGRLLEEDLLHFAVLQVVQLPHCILGALDQLQHYRGWPFTQQEPVLGGHGGVSVGWGP